MAELTGRPSGQPGCRGFGTGKGAGLVASALLIAVLTLPMASAALAYRTPPDGTTGGPPAAQAEPGQASQPAMGHAGPGRVTPDGSALQTLLGRRQAAATEKHIATLHRKLQVTPLQEPLWQPLAALMRDDVVALDRVYAQREKSSGSMSAVDDLKSYGMVQQVHARNVQNLLGPFQALYDSFSPSQKQQADETFRSFTDNAVKNSR